MAIDWKEKFYLCGMERGRERVDCFSDLSRFAESVGNYRDAAEASEAAGEFERARRMWSKESRRLEQKGYYWDASVAAELAGEEDRSKRLRDIIIIKSSDPLVAHLVRNGQRVVVV